MRRGRSVRYLTAVTLACAVTGCLAPDPDSDPAQSPSVPSATQAAPSPSHAAPPEPVTLAFAGDIHFEGSLRPRLAKPRTALAPIPEELAAADLAMANLETSLGTGGRPEPGKRFTFQTPSTALTALSAAGIDVASMANNHALDFGRETLPEAFAAIDTAAEADPSLTVVGLGRNASAAFAAAFNDVRGTTIATLAGTIADADPTADPTGQWAASTTTPGTADASDPRRLLQAVQEVRRVADVVVVYMHWGIQGQSCPSDAQRSLAEDLVSAGADVIVGSHAHLLQGDGRLGRGYVAYGLGNFAWYTQTPQTSTTGVLTLTVAPSASRSARARARVIEAAWAPARIGTDGLPRALAPTEVDAFRENRATLRQCSGLAAP